MAKRYQKTVIEACDGQRRVTITIECGDHEQTLVPDEFKNFHKSAADNVMGVICGIKHFYPHLSDVRVRNRR